jgi:hypothetical protein
VTLASKQIPKKATPLKRNSNLLKPVLRIIDPYFFYAMAYSTLAYRIEQT